ncbi:MAG: GNAT family N-acetyltransferase [Sphingorhabdus sp.]|uniref:GNAT family N-acetyltransferase n=1 Tax=Sphingorhabdus sp. TaxID=1902408 RepID=UPI003C95375C
MIDRTILPASSAQHQAVIDTLSDAFMTDPALSFIVPDEAARTKMLPKLFALLVPDDANAGTVMRSGNDEAAALWRYPGMAKDAGGTSFALMWNMLRIFGFSIARASTVADALAAHLPDGRYHYLHFVGVKRTHQGKGWGGAIIREGLARADADNLPTWLETATPENVPLYQRLGFVTQVEWDIPKGGPHFWGMMRAPG